MHIKVCFEPLWFRQRLMSKSNQWLRKKILRRDSKKAWIGELAAEI